jgi:alpha-galactosidase
MTPEIREILTNRDVIAVDQDTLGKGGQPISHNGDTEVWARPLANGDYAVALFNRGESEADIWLKWSAIGLGAKAAVRDLWLHKSLGTVADGFQTKVGPHGVALIRVVKQ